jgi:hypothetical protein
LCTHAYWNKDADTTRWDETRYSDAEQLAFRNQEKFYWNVEDYNPDTFQLKDYKTNNLSSWESLNGLTPSTGLKKGDKVYVARPITNRHRMATYLAVQDTMLEIQKLWDSAAGKTLGSTGKTMQEVFKLDKDSLSSAGVAYQALWPKDSRP